MKATVLFMEHRQCYLFMEQIGICLAERCLSLNLVPESRSKRSSPALKV